MKNISESKTYWFVSNLQTDGTFQTGSMKNRQSNWIRHGCTSDHHFRAHFVSSSMFTYFPFGAASTHKPTNHFLAYNKSLFIMSGSDSNKNEIYISQKKLKTRATTNNFEEISISCVLNFNFAIVFCITNDSPLKIKSSKSVHVEIMMIVNTRKEKFATARPNDKAAFFKLFKYRRWTIVACVLCVPRHWHAWKGKTICTRNRREFQELCAAIKCRKKELSTSFGIHSHAKL